jgi:hypothetical protein
VQSPSLATVLRVLAGLGIMLASFWITLQVLDTRNAAPDQNLIQVTEATYGMNCAGFAVPAGYENRVKAGNITQKVSDICEAARDSCEFFVNVSEIGDPAPGCGKDFSVNWRCGRNETIHRIGIAAEANGKPVSLRCR